ncbi:MAG TPA: hypothetical protein VF508_08890, partial [Pyrinomonadaceae bacterium]
MIARAGPERTARQVGTACGGGSALEKSLADESPAVINRQLMVARPARRRRRHRPTDAARNFLGAVYFRRPPS